MGELRRRSPTEEPGAGPGPPGQQPSSPGLWAGCPQGPSEARGASPTDVGAGTLPGPSCPFSFHSFTFGGFDTWRTPPGAVAGLPRPQGKVLRAQRPACPWCLPRGPGVAPTPSAHGCRRKEAGCRRKEAGSDRPRGQARPQPRVLVMDAPRGGKARAPAGRGGSGGQRWRWPLTWGPEEVRAGHGEGTTGDWARCEKSQCCQELGVQGSQTSQTQLGRSLVLDSGSGHGVSCAAYFWCDLSTLLSRPGPQFSHLSDGVMTAPCSIRGAWDS